MIEYKTDQDSRTGNNSNRSEKLDSWKEIASYLGREVRTVQRWEKLEALPVHRHHHDKLGTVYAYRSEIDAWLKDRSPRSAPTETSPQNGATPSDSRPDLPPASHQRPSIQRRALFASFAGLILLALAGSIVIERKLNEPWPSFPHDPAPKVVTIAVLPLQNLSGSTDPDWFTEGLTEELTVQLERVRGFQVLGRTSTSKLAPLGPKELEAAAQDLSLDYVVTGTVRREGQRVRVTAQLLAVKNLSPCWADTYEGDLAAPVAVQAEIGFRIAEGVSTKLALVADAVRPGPLTSSKPALEAYLKGQYEWHRATDADLKKSLEFFKQASDLDPSFAQAYAGTAEAYVAIAGSGMKAPKDCLPEAEEAAKKALSLNDSVAEAHVALGEIRCEWYWDWSGAEKEFLRALDLAPGLATAHHAYAHFLSEMGRHSEAIAEARRAQELEPLSAAINSDAGWFYFRARRYDDALAECRKVLDIEPGFRSAEACIIQCLIKEGRLEEARSEARRFVAGHGQTAQTPGLDAADPAEALRNLRLDSLAMLKKVENRQYVSPYAFASLYSQLGDRDSAFKWLETAYQQRDRVMVLLNVHPTFDPIRDDPRFDNLVRRVGLPAPKSETT